MLPAPASANVGGEDRETRGESVDHPKSKKRKAASPNPAVERNGYTPLADRLNPRRAGFDPEFKKRYAAMSKTQRKKIAKEDRAELAVITARTASIRHNFEANENDHCETPPQAYKDIKPLLEEIAARLGKEPAQLDIWDPYFCAGAVARHLGKLGFERVRNENADCYELLEGPPGDLPPFDVLVTNPPYSGDHVERLLRFVAAASKEKKTTRHEEKKRGTRSGNGQKGRAFFLLIPDYFEKRAFYRPGFAEAARAPPLRLRPKARYPYWTPPGLRPAKLGGAEDQQGQERGQSGPKSKAAAGGAAEARKARGHHNLALGHRTSPFSSSWHMILEPILGHAEVIFVAGQEGFCPAGCALSYIQGPALSSERGVIRK
eukprot:CAMPEP_0172650924 /NCGR_PEP_ID=MMETSP1068-20121228/242542_1 /TAXON_ID=35684 /ORGANISM="Pseudopedinella elastica, Strain CCMP716" /LENGTH=375 /DNA_ID=CAMNT_0013465301 /DNA_START=319 /DNA_END=1446 /DNA_ORIENTATION=-